MQRPEPEGPEKLRRILPDIKVGGEVADSLPRG
jgi:hypothetical protein